MASQLNSYDLSRAWFDFCFENPEKIKPSHTALYFFAIEHCNRLGWKVKFGFPTKMTMDAIGVKSFRAYSATLSDLVEWGFVIMIEKSKNQYSSNIISLATKFDKKMLKSLDKAMIQHSTSLGQKGNSTGNSNSISTDISTGNSTYQSTGKSKATIDKHRTNNIEPINQFIYPLSKKNNFLRIGVVVYKTDPSEYFKKNFSEFFENCKMRYGEGLCQKWLNLMDEQKFGATFTDDQHVRNTFNSFIKTHLTSKNDQTTERNSKSSNGSFGNL